MQTQPKTSPVSRVRQWRYHSAVQAARVLNALAEPGDREYALARAVTDSPRTFARGAGPAPSRA